MRMHHVEEVIVEDHWSLAIGFFDVRFPGSAVHREAVIAAGVVKHEKMVARVRDHLDSVIGFLHGQFNHVVPVHQH